MLHCFPRDANVGSLNQEAPKLPFNWKFFYFSSQDPSTGPRPEPYTHTHTTRYIQPVPCFSNIDANAILKYV